jgi:hypothetical protein
MEVSHSLLVTMMFVIILSMGIGNIIITLANVVNRRSTLRSDKLHTSWMIMMLLVHFNLFWHALAILDVEEWEFPDFLFMIAGPVLAFFSTSVLLPDASDSDADDVRGHYFNSAGQFFFLLGLLQLWIIGADFFLGNGFTVGSTFNLAVAALAFVLAMSKSPVLHRGGAVAGWTVFLTMEVLRGMKVL